MHPPRKIEKSSHWRTRSITIRLDTSLCVNNLGGCQQNRPEWRSEDRRLPLQIRVIVSSDSPIGEDNGFITLLQSYLPLFTSLLLLLPKSSQCWGALQDGVDDYHDWGSGSSNHSAIGRGARSQNTDVVTSQQTALGVCEERMAKWLFRRCYFLLCWCINVMRPQV